MRRTTASYAAFIESDIHPKYVDGTVRRHVISPLDPLTILIGICNVCHPFYGQQKFVDTAGRVDKFQQRLEDQAAGATPPAAAMKKRGSRIDLIRPQPLPEPRARYFFLMDLRPHIRNFQTSS
jgi:large subunit ribosomal protein L31